MFDIKKIEEEARKEVVAEQAESAKAKIKAHLAKITAAKKVVANLELEYQALLADIGA